MKLFDFEGTEKPFPMFTSDTKESNAIKPIKSEADENYDGQEVKTDETL